jgi:hypothetical protein
VSAAGPYAPKDLVVEANQASLFVQDAVPITAIAARGLKRLAGYRHILFAFLLRIDMVNFGGHNLSSPKILQPISSNTVRADRQQSNKISSAREHRPTF